ncbi:PglZ domain-containing protein [Deinococcus reticulitermitis]|uniref:PglZ domain-containing protein n=1 Tax=Deinococcus reticulitermitis TaxID=856736 RepID=A0A1H6WL30_9DEIO|nr:PglZ domain-containing protein [Deinococcus reticulitermitis]SEJ17648.1 PglZ domain-containing protein [Deinococcus reticulitermitis]
MTGTSHPVTEHARRLLRDALRRHGTVVLYDPDRHLEEVATSLNSETQVVIFSGSYLAVKLAAEETFCALRGTGPWAEGTLLLYVSATPQPANLNPLEEYERAGTRLSLPLDVLAREALADRMTPGQVNALFEAPVPPDLARLDEYGRQAILDTGALAIVYGSGDPDLILERFITSPELDGAVKFADLAAFLRATLGASGKDTAALRADTWAQAFTLVTSKSSEATEQRARATVLLNRLRHSSAALYAESATQLQDTLTIHPPQPTDTVWLPKQDDLAREAAALALQEGRLDLTRAYLDARSTSFWAARPERLAAWEVLTLVLNVTSLSATVRSELKGTLSHLTQRYVESWHDLDRAARALDTLVDIPAGTQQAVRQARVDYAETLYTMNEALHTAYRKEGFQLPLPAQTRIFLEAVTPAVLDGPTAYLLVDALRYDLGADLASEIRARDGALHVRLEARSAVLPTITPFGMAALLPGAENGLTLGEQGVPVLKDVRLPDLRARTKYLEQAAAELHPEDTTLDKLPKTDAALKKKIDAGVQLLVVRCGDLDTVGEADAAVASAFPVLLREVRDAVLRLLSAGFRQVVVAADHGFLMLEGDAAHLTPTPDGTSVISKRRVWLGAAGAMPAGVISVPASGADLHGEQAAALTLAFPPGRALFKTTGNTRYTHGGPSLQERVVPLITISREAKEPRFIAKRQKTPGTLSAGLQLLPGTTFLSGHVLWTHESGLFNSETATLTVRLECQNPAGDAAVLFTPSSATGEVTLQPNMPLPVMFTAPVASKHWTLRVRDASGAELTVATTLASSQPLAPQSAWQTPAGAPTPSDNILPFLNAVVKQKDMSEQDLDELRRKEGLKRSDLNAFKRYVDALLAAGFNSIALDMNTLPARYRHKE